MLLSVITQVTLAVIFSYILCGFMTTSAGRYPVKEIKQLSIGFVKNIEVTDDYFMVTNSKNVTYPIPRNHPVQDEYINQELSTSPLAYNNGIALVQFTDGTTDWLPARLHVQLDTAVNVNGKTKKLNEVHKTELINDTRDNKYTKYLYCFIDPVPSAYKIFYESQYFEHNFDLLYTDKADYFDVVFSYSNSHGYEIIYIQKSQFESFH